MPLNLRDDPCDLVAQRLLPRYYGLDLLVKYLDIDYSSCVLLIHIGGNRKVVVLRRYVAIGYEFREMVSRGSFNEAGENCLDVCLRQLVVVGDLHALLGRVDEERAVLSLGSFQHKDAGGDRRAEEEVVRKLDHAVDKVIVDEVLANLPLCATPVHHPGETDDRSRAVRGEPGKAMHDEGEIGFRLWREHARRRESRIVDEEGIVVAFPSDGVGGIGHDGLERLVIPMQGIGQCVTVADIELVVVDVMQEHVDPAKIVGSDVDFLPKETLPHILLTQHLGGLEEEGA